MTGVVNTLLQRQYRNIYLKKKKKTQKPIKRTLSNTQKNWYYLGNFSILDGNPVEKMRQFLYTWHLLLINPKINDPSSNI